MRGVRSWLAVGAVAALSMLADRRYRLLPRPPMVEPPPSWPSLSVIVPARNEAANLPRLLPSLLHAGYPGPLELIVVDDGSVDETAALAAYYGARVLRLTGPPPGWLGKPHACQRGAEVATGDWLLFTDADTLHAPGGPARAVAWCLSDTLDGLTLFPGQERGVPGDAAVLAVAFAGYFAGRGTPAGLLNGQYLLLRQTVYEASGGFASVRDQPLEDLAFGRQLAAAGYRVPAARGDALVRVRMYAGYGQMWRGFTRLAALSLRWSGPGALITAAFTAAAATPALDLADALARGRGRGSAAARWLLVCAALAPWLRRYRASGWSIAAPLAAALIEAAAIWGLVSRLLGRRIIWRGRSI